MIDRNARPRILDAGTPLVEPTERQKGQADKMADLLCDIGANHTCRVFRYTTPEEDPGSRKSVRAICGTIQMTDDVIENFNDVMCERFGGGHYIVAFFEGRKYIKEGVYDIDTSQFPTVDRRPKKETPAATPQTDVAAIIAAMQASNAQLLAAIRETQPRDNSGQMMEMFKFFHAQSQAQVAQAERGADRLITAIQAQHAVPVVAQPVATSALQQLQGVAEMMTHLDAIRGDRSDGAAPQTMAEQFVSAFAKPAAEAIVSRMMPAQPALPAPAASTAPVIPATPRPDPATVRIPSEAVRASQADIAKWKAERPEPGTASRPSTEVPPAPLVTAIPTSSTTKVAV